MKNRYIASYKIFESDEFRPPEYREFRQNQELRHKLLNTDKKAFDDIYSKHKWYLVNNNKPLIKNNLFTLVNLAYDDIGGHVRINSPDKVVQDQELNFWTAIDVNNNDPYADAVIFGKKTKYGIKISGFGHTTKIDSTGTLIDHLIKLLSTIGYFIEACGKVGKMLLRHDAPVVHDIDVIKEIFVEYGKDAIFLDPEHIWYKRTINVGTEVKEILFGKPINV